MVLIIVGICVLVALILVGGIFWLSYESKDVKREAVKKERNIGITDISEAMMECLKEEGAKVTTHSIDYCGFTYLGYELYALLRDDFIRNDNIKDNFLVEFKYIDESKYSSNIIPKNISKGELKSKLLEDTREMLKQIKTYKEDFNLLSDIKNNFKDLIVDEEEDELLLEYNHIPITIRDFTRMFDSKEEVKVYHGNRLIKTNMLSHDIYSHIMNEEYFDSYNERVYSLGEVKPALEEIESKLLYDLSNFTDAFRSMMNVRINGFTLDMNSLVVKEDYTMKFEYFNEFNTYYFEVKPFHKQYSYRKNDLDTRQGSFTEYRSLLYSIKRILEESKAMVPFDTEERPSMVFNNTTGQLEIDNKKYLSY
ncbi:hypothetical protein [Staphylococcus phage vB_SsapH-Golestan101-M]|nr:hypothetical protein [Staphylococcus phage vB_SsapH-Golestan101-M]